MTNSVWAATGPSTIGLRKADSKRPGRYIPVDERPPSIGTKESFEDRRARLTARILTVNGKNSIVIGKPGDSDKTARIRGRG